MASREQRAYRIRAGEWDSGKVASNSSILVPYAGRALVSGERVTWQAKVWTDTGESDWSEPSWWEMGLLEAEDWVAQWIEPAESEAMCSHATHPAYLLRSSFLLDTPVARARLYATAHGVYEFFVNGQRVGDMELTPGCTSYRSNVQVQTFDISSLLFSGENVVCAVVSDGWFRGQTGLYRQVKIFGESVALLAQLHVYDAAGSVLRVGTGPDWVSATGSIREADLMKGQAVDLRCEPSAWEPVTVRDYDLSQLRASPAPPVRRIEQLRPIAVTQPRPDTQVVDLGQNINGWVRLSNLGPKDTVLTLTHGEALDADGDVTLANVVTDVRRVAAEVQGSSDRPWPRDFSNLDEPLQVDHVISAGEPDALFEPRHTIHGFRYVRIEGHPDQVTADDVAGVVVHTDLQRVGWFECSDERINRLHEAAVWTFRSNACDLPTDCPTRERLGWTAEWQAFMPAAAFLYDIAGFTTKWLRDVAADQAPDGAVAPYSPYTVPAGVSGNIESGAGWADAAVIVPWRLFREYGDRRLLEEQWPSMSAWVDYAARKAREQRHPDRIAARPVAAAHEEYILDSGIGGVEWLEAGVTNLEELTAASNTENSDLATAYFHYSARLLAEMARVLGRVDEVRYSALAAVTKRAWQAEFIRADGRLARETQAAYVRALAFDLVPEELRGQMVARLVELIREADTHPTTGNLSTGLLLPVLADLGHADVAYELLFQNTEPSWLTMIDRGATTIWESWHAVDGNGAPRFSLNHCALGAVISFLHRYVAGIRLSEVEPAYRRFQIAPVPGGGITSAHAVHDSPYGRVESAWRTDGQEFILDITVPSGTLANVQLPDGRATEAHPGRSTYRCRRVGP
jgi:alpha-L-rhamnosidase